MLAVLRLYLLKSKRVPLLITGIMTILVLWAFTLKAVVSPDTPINARIDLSLTNLGLFIYIIATIIKRDNLNKDGFLLRLPVSDREIVVANILSMIIISVITIVLTITVFYLLILFFKFAGYNITLPTKIVSTEKLNTDSFSVFLYAIMYTGIIFSTHTLLQTYTSKSGAKWFLIGTPILLLFLVPTILAIFFKTTEIHITEAMWNAFWNRPFWHSVKVILKVLWRLRLILGFIYILLAYRLRYLKEV